MHTQRRPTASAEERSPFRILRATTIIASKRNGDGGNQHVLRIRQCRDESQLIVRLASEGWWATELRRNSTVMLFHKEHLENRKKPVASPTGIVSLTQVPSYLRDKLGSAYLGADYLDRCRTDARSSFTPNLRLNTKTLGLHPKHELHVVWRRSNYFTGRTGR